MWYCCTLLTVFLFGCGIDTPRSCPTSPAGEFLGTLNVETNGCDNMLPDINYKVPLSIPEDSDIRECGEHFVKVVAKQVSPDCEETMVSYVVTTEEGYTGRIQYELACTEPFFSCISNISVDFLPAEKN